MRLAHTDCGQPHCVRCRPARDAAASRRLAFRDVAVLVGVLGLGAVLLVLLVLALVWPR